MQTVQHVEFAVRRTAPEEYGRTEHIIREAFWDQFCPGCCEHYLLHLMRGSDGLVPETDIVAVHKESIVGCAACMEGLIEGDDGHSHKVWTLGPIGVLPMWQGMGAGSAMIRHIIDTAKSDPAPDAILLCGDPDYYVRHGFEPAALQIAVLPQAEGKTLAGRYREHSVYNVNPAAAEAFDSGFPHKEKLEGVKMQKRFAELTAMCRKA